MVLWVKLHDINLSKQHTVARLAVTRLAVTKLDVTKLAAQI